MYFFEGNWDSVGSCSAEVLRKSFSKLVELLVDTNLTDFDWLSKLPRELLAELGFSG
jgi:hypothetical protein